MARGGEEVNAMVEWKTLSFWRAEQQKPRKQRVTHVGHFNPEGDVERAFGSIAGTQWGAGGTNPQTARKNLRN